MLIPEPPLCALGWSRTQSLHCAQIRMIGVAARGIMPMGGRISPMRFAEGTVRGSSQPAWLETTGGPLSSAWRHRSGDLGYHSYRHDFSIALVVPLSCPVALTGTIDGDACLQPDMDGSG
jgi:hypothetical protein